MKKIIVLLLMVAFGLKSQAQLLQGDGFDANKGYEIGLIGGVLGIYDDLSYGAFGLNFTAYGIYVDFLGMPRAHEKSTDVDKHENEKTSIGAHLGYQFPLTNWLSIIPVVGYASVKNGTTDGSFQYQESSSLCRRYPLWIIWWYWYSILKYRRINILI